MTTWIVWLGMTSAFILLGYSIYFFRRLNLHHTTSGKNPLPASIVVCARNEEKHLPALLSRLVAQDHPALEIVLINDNSTDQTASIMQEWCNHFPYKIQYVSIPDKHIRQAGGKKDAFRLGVDTASHSIILCTDADCMPASNSWASIMTGLFDDKTDFVLGHSPARSGYFLSRWDNFVTALQYLSYAAAGTPYMGVGRNMAFRKETWKSFSAEAAHRYLSSGDDDLPVNQLAHAHNTSICIHPDAVVFTDGEQSFSEWIQRKVRHSRTGLWYKPQHQILLTGYAFAKWIFYTCWMLSFLLVSPAVMLLLSTAMIIHYGFLHYPLAKMGYSNLRKLYPFADILHSWAIALLPVLLLLPMRDYWRHSHSIQTKG